MKQVNIESMQVVSERNGFVIREDKDNRFKYVVYHPNFDGVYIDAFKYLEEAEEFCDEEDPVVCAEDIQNGFLCT
jgi:hypothetical protein